MLFWKLLAFRRRPMQLSFEDTNYLPSSSFGHLDSLQ